jgi:DNA polymerase
LLVENIVQAISRDILAEAVYSMEMAGYPVAYHVHDSVVSNTPAKQAKKAMEYAIEVLSTSPEWAKGMRLGAEGTLEEVFA